MHLIFDVKNKFSVGDKLELFLPQGSQDIIAERMSDMEGLPIQEAPGGGYRVKIPLPVSTGSNGLLAHYISKPNPAVSNF